MQSKHLLSLCLLAASLAPAPALAQRFSAGVIVGAGLTDAFHDQTFHGVDTVTHFFSDSKDFVVGPMVEVGFPANISVEADLLYRPLHLAESNLVIPTGTFPSSTTVGTWQFPLLLKYRFPTLIPWAKPLLEVGPSFRAGSGSSAAPSSHGLTLGAGLEAKILRLKLAPQLRFTRWASDKRPLIFAAPQSNANQVEFLVGLSF
jgi:hypothetical protein